MNKRLIILLIPLLFLSCEEEIVDEFDCVTLTADLTVGLEAYSNNPADTASCLSLKDHAAEFISNSCDTSGIGDLSFLADSLDCGMMACATPIANLLVYGLAQTSLVDPDSLTYCAYYDSSVAAMEAIVAAGGCEQEGFQGITQEMVDSVKSAGCDWTAPVANAIIGRWVVVRQCLRSDGENCAGGNVDCQEIESGAPGNVVFDIFEDETMTATVEQCRCEDENGDYIEGCDYNAEYAGDQTACESLGGYWEMTVDSVGTMLWSESDPNQFQVTVDESRCSCEDEDGNENSDCDWDEVDNAQDQASCEAVNGIWVPEFIPVNFLVSAGADTLSYSFQEYDDPNCSCYDEDDNYIAGCDSDVAYNAEDEAACGVAGGRWEGGWECITVYTVKF